ncbi:hypothetical protein SH668x_002985 [Planctomicrobium sp. SH668]|uniref:hypothetical protein n=1 Tax=Planctomicrobium sp. SH668 TaxID=3448126 RepID=UPI003F5BE738
MLLEISVANSQGVERTLELASIALRSSRFGEIDRILESAALRSSDPRLWMMLGVSQACQGNAEKGVSAYERAVEIGQGVLDPSQLLSVFLGLWECHSRSGRQELGKYYYQRALKLYFKQSATTEPGSIPLSLQFATLVAHRAEFSQRELQNALVDLRSQIADPDLAAKVEFELSRIASTEESIAWLDKCWRNFRRSGNLFQTMRSLEVLATRLLELQHWLPARNALRLANRVAGRLKKSNRVQWYRSLDRRIGVSLQLLASDPELN